jgi:hypothetical protein
MQRVLIMGYLPQPRTARGFVRRSEKAKQKKSDKERSRGSRASSKEHVLTSEEIVDRTLNTLSHLGNQRFSIPPFHEHFNRWLLSLQTVLSEFESNPTISVDDQFTKQYSQVLSDIEQALKEKREKEASHEKKVREINQNLLEARNLLARAEREQAAKKAEISDRRKRALKPVANKLERIRREQNRADRSKTSFLKNLFKKAQPQREAETTKIPDPTKREFSKIEQSFADEQGKLQDEYSRRKQEILQKIANHQKEIGDLDENMPIDDAVNLRCEACEALINAVNTLLSRTKAASEKTSL